MTTTVPMLLPTNFTDGSTPPVLNVTYNSSNQSPGYNISITGLVGGSATSVTVVRHDNDNQLADAPVRGLDTVTIQGDTLTATDYELPWQYRFSYVLYAMNSAGVTLYTVTAAGPYSLTVAASIPTVSYGYSSAYFRDPNTPSLTQPLWVESVTPVSYGVRAQKSSVINRQNNVYTMDILGGRSGSISFIIDGSVAYGSSLLTRLEYENLLRGGPVFLLQSTFQPDAFPDLYFIISGPPVFEHMGIVTNVSRPSGFPNGEQGQLVFKVTVPFDEVDRPNTTGQSSVSVTTWQSIVNHYSTWQVELNSNSSWQAALNSGA